MNGKQPFFQHNLSSKRYDQQVEEHFSHFSRSRHHRDWFPKSLGECAGVVLVVLVYYSYVFISSTIEGKQNFKIGANFSSKEKNLTDWVVEEGNLTTAYASNRKVCCSFGK